MRRFKFVALVLVCALLLSGCALVSIDRQRVANQVVATVNGVKILKKEISEEQVRYNVEMTLYYSYGTTSDQLDAEILAQMYQETRESILQSVVLNEVMLQKAVGMGITLTEEEMAENRKQADDYYKSILDSFIEDAVATPAPAPTEAPSATAAPTATPTPTEAASGTPGADETETASTAPAATPTPAPSPSPTVAPSPTATPSPTPMPSLNALQQAEVDGNYQDYVDSYGSADDYYQMLNEADIIAKVKEWIDEQAVVTDGDAKAWYDTMLEQQTAAAKEDVSVFSGYVESNNIITFVPEDTVAVKQVFLKFKDAELVEEAQALYENDQKEMAFRLLQPQIDALMPVAQEVWQRLQAGESIDDLIAEFGEDPGMQSSPGNTYGYLVSESTAAYVEEFSEAALKLFTVGSISEPTVSYMGIHVLQSINTYDEGVIPFEELGDRIKTALLPTAKSAKFDELTQQWLSEASVTYNYNRLNSHND